MSSVGDFRNVTKDSFEVWDGKSWVLAESSERLAYKQAVADAVKIVKALPQEIRSFGTTSIDLDDAVVAIEALSNDPVFDLNTTNKDSE